MSEPDGINPVVFYPRRTPGLVFHVLSLGLLLIGGGYALWQAVNAQVGTTFIYYLIPAGAAILIAGQFLFSLYGLWTGTYTLDRDGVRLRWGLRSEDIPGNDILWVASERDAPFRLRYPIVRWLGSVVGARRLADGRRLEFMADRGRGLTLIATQNVIYIVSPEKTQEFLTIFGNIAEQGVIAPLEARSEGSIALLARFWSDLPARFLAITAAVLALILVVATALLVGSRDTIVLHAGPLRMEPAVLPAVRLMLLPVLNTLFTAVDLVLGILFYRSAHIRPLAYIMWTAAVVSGVLFSMAVIYTLFFA